MDPDEPRMTARDMWRMSLMMAGISAASFAAAAFIVWKGHGWSRATAAFPLAQGSAYAYLAVAGLREAASKTVSEVLDS